MSRSNLNKIILVGNLGSEPEKRITPKGHTVVKLSLATKRKYKNAAGELVEEVTWHKVTVWGKMGEACANYLTTGSRVYLEGELQMQNWKDKEGKSRRSPEVVVNSIHFLSGTKASGKPAEAEEAIVLQ